MIDRTHELPVVRQCEVLELSRSSVYYQRRPVPPADLALMRAIDELHLEFPFAGARMLRDLLRLMGVCVIRGMPVQDSAACRSMIPRDVGPRFRGKPVQRVRRDNPATLDPFSLLGGGRGGAAEVIRAQESRGSSSPV